MGSGVSMEYIDEKWKNIKKYMFYSGLKRAMTFYVVMAFLGVSMSMYGILNLLEGWQEMVLNANDTMLAEEIAFRFQVAQITIYMILCIVSSLIVSHLYYRAKLDEPFQIIREEMAYCARNDLSFDCSYLSGDEMEEICSSLNDMRLQLVENHRNAWGEKERQKDINAVFAHDLRTPLTVMKGYLQMLMRFEASDELSKEKVENIYVQLFQQVDRLERFADTMKDINGFEEWEINRKKVSAVQMDEQIQQVVAGVLAFRLGIRHGVRVKLERDAEIWCDLDFIQQVLENLLNNALRHAEDFIWIEVIQEEAFLRIYVKDDGEGFSKEAIRKALKPYYTTDDSHFGMGLFISEMLSKKHGGYIELINAIDGGAIVSATFYIK